MQRPCPTCERECTQDRSNPDRPFCSERCRMVDLGHWLDESYVIPGPPTSVPEVGRQMDWNGIGEP